MASKSTSPFRWSLNHYIVLFLLLIIFGTINYVGYKRYVRADYSLNRYHELSNQTLKILNGLSSEVKITSCTALKGGDDLAQLIQEDVQRLLAEYKYRAKGKIIIRQIDALNDFDEAEKLVQQFKLTDNQNVLIVQKGEQTRILKIGELADIDTSTAFLGGQPKVKSFKAESEITNSILALAYGMQYKVYFTSGHGEPSIKGSEDDLTSISILAGRLRLQNTDVIPLNLVETGRVPEDAALLVILGPKTPFTNDEISSIKDYLNQKGHIFILLNPETTTGLENILEPYGIVFENNLVLRQVLAVSPSGVKQGVALNAVAVDFASHPSTAWMSWLRDGKALFPLAQSRSLRTRKPDVKEPEAVKLLQTSSKDWAKTKLNNLQNNPGFDPKEDQAGPFTMAAAVDTGAVYGSKVNIGGMKAVAVGSANFLLNKNIGALQTDFFLNATNWILGQENILGITPKVPRDFALSISETQWQWLSSFALVLLPAAGLIIGGMVWLRRRK